MTNREKDFLESITDEIEDAAAEMNPKEKASITGFVERLRTLIYLGADESQPAGHP